MLQLISTFLAIVYLIMACCLFIQWLDVIQQNKYMTLGQIIFSRVFLILATILWPLVVPIAYLELLLKSKKNREVIGLWLDQPIYFYRK